jgi:DNA-directed RNA polymerase subunit RPC12/RpoP
MSVRIREYLTRRFPQAMSSFFDALIWAAMTFWAAVQAAWSPIGQTMGERIKRRVQLAVSLGVGGLALCVAAFAWPTSGAIQLIAAFILAVAGCGVFFVGLYLSGSLECPRCGSTVSPRIFVKGRPKRCPHCRANFDEPPP